MTGVLDAYPSPAATPTPRSNAKSPYGNQYFYSWDVAANGLVTGRYWAAGTFPPAPPTELLGPFAWAQPAGGC